MTDFISRLPKAELHVHIEGTLEPEMMLDLAKRNGHELPFGSLKEVEAAYRFTDLQSFLDIYYQGAAVLRTPEDFYLLMSAYLERAAADGVRHAEIFFDPQTHTERGIGFEVFMEGLRAGIADARSSHGLSADLILCFLRHLSGADAVKTIHEAEPHLQGVVAVGLDSSEKGRPPEIFEKAYEIARGLGLRAVAHAGEEGPPEYVIGALDILGVERIDHGDNSLQDPDLVERLARDSVPLTVCPLSRVALKGVDTLEDHPLPTMIEHELNISLHSDDPPYFGGYVAANYAVVQDSLGISDVELAQLARNSVTSSFLDDSRKEGLVAEIDAVVEAENSA